MTLLLAVLVLVVIVNCCFMAYLIADVTAHSTRAEREPGNVLWLGVISFFQFLLSTFGISDFAVGAAIYSKLRWVPAKLLPGTVNTAAAIPIAVMALIYITSIEVGIATLLVPIVAQVAGTYISVRFVVKMPVRPIRIFLALGMLVTVLRIAAESFGFLPSGGFGFFPSGGTATSLETGKLVLLGCLCFLYGALNNLGIGCFAPIIVTTYALGLNPAAAFPIMVGACTFSIPVSSIQFIRHDSYSRKVTVISAIGGTLGVLVAAFVVRDMAAFPIKWLVALFLLYSAYSMLAAGLRGDADTAVAQNLNARADKSPKMKLSIVGHLTSFFLVLVLLCTVSLVCVFVRNFHVISSGYIEMGISEHNTRLSDNVYAYLREHERVLLSARAGAVHFMAEEPVDLERFRRYLERSSRVLDDISTLYCTTNQVWNRPGGYAVFSQQWDVPLDWNNRERLWFAAAKAADGRVAYSKPYLDALTGDIILDMSVNIYDAEGNDIGVASEAITIAAINSMLRKYASLEGQQVFLIDSDGTFVVHPDKNMAARENFFNVFRATGFEKYRADILSGSAERFSVTENGMTLFSSSIPVAGWFVVSVIPAEKILTSAYDQIIGFFLTPLPIILFMLLAFLIIMRRESRDKLAAERHTKEKDYFIARMSHEIRTPMNAVIGMSELARQDYGKPKGLEYIAGIKNAGVSLLAIINDILDFSKIESGRLELSPAPYKIAGLLNDVLTIVRVQMSEKPIELFVDADPNLPCVLIGDALRVKQVMLNLLSNAVKYTDKGFIRLRASAISEDNSFRDDKEDTVLLSFAVEDSGVGIKPGDMTRLFDEFTRIDEKRHSSIEGTGLGLSIALSLCRAMGGDLEASSEYGKGSVFTAVLTQGVADRNPMGPLSVPQALSAPLAQSAQFTPDTFLTQSAAPDVPLAQYASFTAPDAEVLVVDDFASNLIVTEGLLRSYNLRVTTCMNGLEAVELVQSRPFDLVLMDHMMPEMDGMEALKAIRALEEPAEPGGRFTELPIVVLTAHAVSGMKEMFMAGGFDDFLSKPIETDKLDAILRRWIPEDKQRDEHQIANGDETPGSGRVRAASIQLIGAAKAEMTAQRLNLLNHYRWHFVNGLTADFEYYEKFASLLEAIAIDTDIPTYMRGTMAELMAAVRRGDAEEINRLLPDMYEALKTAERKASVWKNVASNDAVWEEETVNLKDTLLRLKTALSRDDRQSVEATMAELRAMNDLSAPMRELYIFLYDALLMGETEKAAGGLAMWLKMCF